MTLSQGLRVDIQSYTGTACDETGYIDIYH